MDKEFYTISVYVDKDENLIGIPCGESDKYGIADIDTVMLLKAPYTDKALETILTRCSTPATQKSTMTKSQNRQLRDTPAKTALLKQQKNTQ